MLNPSGRGGPDRRCGKRKEVAQQTKHRPGKKTVCPNRIRHLESSVGRRQELASNRQQVQKERIGSTKKRTTTSFESLGKGGIRRGGQKEWLKLKVQARKESDRLSKETKQNILLPQRGNKTWARKPNPATYRKMYQQRKEILNPWG